LCECELDPLGIVLVGKNGAEKKSMGLSINKMAAIISARSRIDKIRLAQPASNIEWLTA